MKKKWSILLVIIANALYLIAGNYQQADELITLYKIDVSNDSIVTDILSDVFSEIDSLKSNSEPFYYDMFLKKDNNQTNVVITGHIRKYIEDVQGCVGYFVYRGKTIFVYSTGKYNIEYCKPPVTMSFKVRKQLPTPYDPDEWLYLIRSNGDGGNNWYKIDFE